MLTVFYFSWHPHPPWHLVFIVEMDSSDSDLDGVNHDVDVEEDEDEDVLEMQMNVGDCGGTCGYVFEPEPCPAEQFCRSAATTTWTVGRETEYWRWHLVHMYKVYFASKSCKQSLLPRSGAVQNFNISCTIELYNRSSTVWTCHFKSIFPRFSLQFI